MSELDPRIEDKARLSRSVKLVKEAMTDRHSCMIRKEQEDMRVFQHPRNIDEGGSESRRHAENMMPH